LRSKSRKLGYSVQAPWGDGDRFVAIVANRQFAIDRAVAVLPVADPKELTAVAPVFLLLLKLDGAGADAEGGPRLAVGESSFH
jgi:hypothetical protein